LKKGDRFDMHRKLILLCVLIAASGLCFVHAEKTDTDKKEPKSRDLLSDLPYYLEIFEMKDKKQINISSFYFVNHLFVHVFDSFNLFPKLQDEDIEYICEETLRGLCSYAPVNLIFNKFKEQDKLAFSLSIISKNDNNYLLILSNFDTKKDRVLSLDTPKEKRANCFSTIFLITSDKLVNENHFYSQEIETKLKKANNPNNLVDFYLFDEKVENDSAIEELLTKAYASPKTPEDKFQTAMLFSLFYMMKHNFKMAGSSLEIAKAVLDSGIKKKQSWENNLSIQNEELKIVRKLVEKGYQ
jgi:hypothetical protein